MYKQRIVCACIFNSNYGNYINYQGTVKETTILHKQYLNYDLAFYLNLSLHKCEH